MQCTPVTLGDLKHNGKTVSTNVADALERAARLGGPEATNCIAELSAAAMAEAAALDAAPEKKELPLYGVPVLVKDNIDAAGMHTTAGSLALTDNLAVTDSPVVRNLKKNGAVIIGKTNMTEFANYTTRNGMPNGYSCRGGQVVHAVDPALDPSGSSSGSGVAVCAGIVPVAVGTDTSFSVIHCAQANGICGIKPPVGTLSAEGVIPIARSLDSAGAMANTMSDALTLYSAMRDEPFPAVQPAKVLHLAVNTANRDRVAEGQMDFLNDMLDKVCSAGGTAEEIEQLPSPLLMEIMKWEFRDHLEDYLRTASASRKTLAEIVDCYYANPETMMKYGITLLEACLNDTPGGTLSEYYADLIAQRKVLREQVLEAIAPYDAVVMTGWTHIMHTCGLPSVTVASRSKNEHGVNRCVIMYGADEQRLYAAALALEQML